MKKKALKTGITEQDGSYLSELLLKKNYSVEEVGLDYRKYVIVDKKLNRASEIDSLLGDCSKTKIKLKWKPEYDFKKLIKDMVNEDINFVKKKKY